MTVLWARWTSTPPCWTCWALTATSARGLGRSILDTAKLPFAISAQNELVTFAPADSLDAGAVEHARQAFTISDMMISGDYFKDNVPQ